MGPACRTLLVGFMLGLDSLVACTRRGPCVSDYRISGFDRLSTKAKSFLAVASVVS